MEAHLELDKRPISFLTLISDPSLYNAPALSGDLTTVSFGGNPLSPSSIGFSPLFPSQKNACTQNLCRPPRSFTFASPCPGIVRSVSGRTPVTSGTFRPVSSLPARSRVCYESLFASYSRHRDTLPGTLFKEHDRTPQGPILLSLLDFRAFHAPSGVLFNFPSQYSSAIGLNTYLVLEVNASQIPAPFPRSSTQDPFPNLVVYLYGTITLYRIPFQKTSSQQPAQLMESPPHYISMALLPRIQFELCRFQSLLLTVSH